MPFRIRFAETAVADLAALPKREAAQVLRKIQRLERGLVGNIKRLQNSDVAYRLRTGDYRVLFDLEGNDILIQRIGNRKDIYG